MKKMVNSEKMRILVLVVYFLFFYLAWTSVQLVFVPRLEMHVRDVVSTFLIDVLIKNLIWTIPAFFLLRKFQDSAYVSCKELFRLQKEHALWLLAVPAIAGYALVLKGISGGFSISSSFGISSILVVLFVGLTEEMVFRGWLLNVTYLGKHPYFAILLNALLFLAIHFPKWIRLGTFFTTFFSGGFFLILLLGVFFSYTFLKSKSLVVPILAHSVYDLVVMMLD